MYGRKNAMNRYSQKIIVGSSIIFLWVLVLLLSAGVTAGSIYFCFKDGIDMVRFLAFCFVAILFGSFAFGSTFYLIRGCNLVCFDGKHLTRKSIFGFSYCTIEIKDIIRIDRVTYFRDGTFYMVIDGQHSTSDRLKKNSAIAIPCNEKGKEFILLFYSGVIPDTFP